MINSSLLLVSPPVEAPAFEDGARGLSWGEFKYRFDFAYGSGVRPLEQSRAGEMLTKRIMRDAAEIRALYRKIRELRPQLSKISTHKINETDPFWVNNWLPAPDAAIIYTLIATGQPRLYLEIGSGNSTKFARRAQRDFKTGTQIVSIDPSPRAEIDSLCDRIIRHSVERLDISKVADLVRPGDVVFVDDSHRSFQNSDSTVCCIELFAALPAGCHFGVHDVFLPFDYPSSFIDRYYNEQYLMMMYLLGGATEDAVIGLTHLTSTNEAFKAEHDAMVDIDVIPEDARAGGGALWLRKGDWHRRFPHHSILKNIARSLRFC